MKKQIDYLEGSKLPPQNIELEEAILGAIMIQSDCLDEIENILKPEIFYNERNSLIYKAILELRKNKKPIDILTVTDELRKKGNLESIGGALYVTQLTSRVVSTTNTLTHSRIVVEKYLLREVIRICGEYISDAFSENVDPFDVLENLKSDTDKAIGFINEDESESFSSALDKEIKEKYKQYINDVKFKGIPTGNSDIDDKIGGFEGSNLYVIAAKEGGGKSARAMAFAKAAAEAEYPVDIFSLEMSIKDYARRFIIEQSSILMSKYRSNNLTRYDWRLIETSVEKLKKLPISIHDSSLCTPNKIRRTLKQKIKKKQKIGMVVVDYIQLMKSDEKTGNREQEIASISRELKSIAKEFDVPVLALAQINRESEKESGAKRPKTSHLRESAALGNDADVVAFIYRPDYYFPYGEHPDDCYSRENISKYEYEITSEFLIAKNRNGEPNQRVSELFIGGYARFTNKKAQDEMPVYAEPENEEPENKDIITFSPF